MVFFIGMAMLTGCGSHEDLPLKKHYYVMQGYRPVALWGK